METFIIVGLGNPGKEYEKTKHNFGFRVIDKCAANNNFPEFSFSKKANALISEKIVDKKKIILAKPQTFMNNSGDAIQKIIAFHKLKTENLIVVHDDIDLSLGKIRIAKNRGSAGHKGVASIINKLATSDFVRLRLGIENSGKGQRNFVKATEAKIKKTEIFVLKPFAKAEEKTAEEIIAKSAAVLEMILKEGLVKTMNQYNNA